MKINFEFDSANAEHVEALRKLATAFCGLEISGTTEPVKTKQTKKVEKQEALQTNTEESNAAAEVKETKEAPAEDKTISLENLKALMGTKMENHRAALRKGLTDMGAANLAELEEAKYPEFEKFLNGLS